MGTAPPSSATDVRYLGWGALVALFTTGLVYLDFWGGSVPAMPSLPVVLAVIGAGALLGAATEYYDEREGFELSTSAFLLLLLSAVLASTVLFPRGLPVAAEVGLIALAWAAFLTRLAFAVGPHDVRGRVAG